MSANLHQGESDQNGFEILGGFLVQRYICGGIFMKI